MAKELLDCFVFASYFLRKEIQIVPIPSFDLKLHGQILFFPHTDTQFSILHLDLPLE